MTRRVQTRLPLDPRAPAKARRSLEPLRSQIDPESFESLRLLVSELVNNSVRHSGRPHGDPIFVTVDLERDSVRAEVVDRGAGFANGRPPPSPEEGTGWGLFLVDQLADDWGHSRGGVTRTWFEITTGAQDRSRSPVSSLRGSQRRRSA